MTALKPAFACERTTTATGSSGRLSLLTFVGGCWPRLSVACRGFAACGAPRGRSDAASRSRKLLLQLFVAGIVDTLKTSEVVPEDAPPNPDYS